MAGVKKAGERVRACREETCPRMAKIRIRRATQPCCKRRLKRLIRCANMPLKALPDRAVMIREISTAGNGRRPAGRFRRAPGNLRRPSMFKGAFTALVTPFKNGMVDEEAFRQHVERQIELGIHGLVPCGTTGESATLSHAEHEGGYQNVRGADPGPRAGHCRRRIQQYGRGHQPLSLCQGCRGRCCAAHHAILQQTDAGRPLPAF